MHPIIALVRKLFGSGKSGVIVAAKMSQRGMLHALPNKLSPRAEGLGRLYVLAYINTMMDEISARNLYHEL